MQSTAPTAEEVGLTTGDPTLDNILDLQGGQTLTPPPESISLGDVFTGTDGLTEQTLIKDALPGNTTSDTSGT